MKLHNHPDSNAQLNLSIPKYQSVYIALSSTRNVFLNEVFTKETSATLTALLLYYDNQSHTEDISIYINSVGGDASALTNIYDVIQMIEAPVQTICLSKAYSAGAFLLAAGTKGKRFIMPHAQVMIHGVQCVFPIIGEDHPTNSKHYYDFLVSSNDMVMKMLSKHTGQSLDKVKQDCSKDLFMNAKEALQYGIVDGIIDRIEFSGNIEP